MTCAFQAISTLSGTACALPLPHVDTDQIMPKQFLKGIDRHGLATPFGIHSSHEGAACGGRGACLRCGSMAAN